MTTMQILNFSGLILNLFGTIMLAISLSKYLTSFHGAIAIHDMTIKGLVNKDGKVLVAESMGNLLKKGAASSIQRKRIGLIMNVLGFIFQLIPFFLKQN
jgi:hypothetical protein